MHTCLLQFVFSFLISYRFSAAMNQPSQQSGIKEFFSLMPSLCQCLPTKPEDMSMDFNRSSSPKECDFNKYQTGGNGGGGGEFRKESSHDNRKSSNRKFKGKAVENEKDVEEESGSSSDFSNDC